MEVGLVAGERPTPLQRLLAAADTGNGISAALDWRKYVFINVDLSVHIHRLPEGEWVCLDAVTLPERSGIGMADTRLFDERGALGRAVQTLLIAPR
jgi:acyl-CoA thioesterase